MSDSPETLECLDVEVKAEIKEVKEDGTFSGIASIYGIEDLQGDIIDKGAFDKTLDENPSRVILWQHDTRSPIGKGTLKIWQSKILIDAKLAIKAMPMAALAYEALKEALVESLSIGFQTIKSTWEEIDGRMIRHITELKLWEVSLVTFGALPGARITRVKSMENEATRQRIKALEESVQALQAAKVATPAETPPQEPAQAKEPPPQEGIEPAKDHSALSSQLKELRGALQWTIKK